MSSAGSERPGVQPRRGGRVVAASLIVLAVVAVALSLARDRIAESLARRWLDQHGVASSLKVRALSLTGLSASLRLGDAANPDLTVERMDVGYALFGPWNGRAFSVQTRSLRLVRPHLRLRLVDGRLNLGSLQPLIDELAKRPPSGAPPPDVSVEDGEATLQTPGGDLHVRGGGALSALNGAVDPFAITASGVRLQGRGGALRAHQDGGRLIAAIDLGDVGALKGGERLNAARVTLSTELPYPDRQGRWVGAARASLAATGVSANGAGARAEDGTLRADVDGALDATAARQAFSGRLQASAQLGAITQGAANFHGSIAQLSLAHLTLNRDATGATLAGDGQASLAAGHGAAGGAEIQALDSTARIQGLRVAVRDGRLTGAATLDGGLAGHGGVPAATAHRIAQEAPALSTEAPYAMALERGLRAFRFAAPRWRAELSDRGARLTLAPPLRLETDSGAHLAFDTPGGVTFGSDGARGALSVALDGGGLPPLKLLASNGSVAASGYQADITAEGALDALFARGARVQLSGRLVGAGARARFSLAACGPVSAQRLAFDPNAVTTFAADVCPGDGPLIEVGPGGWSARGRLQQAHGVVRSFTVDFQTADGTFAAAGHGGVLDTVTLRLDHGVISDATDPIRFRPVSAAGGVALARGVWLGDFTARTKAGHAIGKLHIRHDVATGLGRADIDASGLSFAPNGLQPGELTPLASFARAAAGPAAFKGWFAWGPRGAATSGGELAGKGLQFKSPLGPVAELDADLRFTSLSPLITAPNQTITVGQVQAMTPLSSLSAQFDLSASTITLEAASGAVAKGHIHLEPLTMPLAAGSTLNGVLVLDHVDVGQIIAASSLAEAVKLDAVVDGRIPFELGPSGLTIRQGRLAATAPGRISISRKALTGGASVAAAPAASAAAGQAAFAQDIAYQAMDNLAFDQLDAAVNSLPKERLGIIFHIKGRHDPPQRQKATIRLDDLIHGRALSKPIALPSDTKIDLTLDTSLNFGELVRALGQAWRDSTGGSGAAPRSAPVHGPGAPVTTQ